MMLLGLDISHTYFKGTPWRKNAIRNVSLGVDSSELLVIYGKNGSGKTTLAKILSGLLKPTRGEVLMCGRNIYEETKRCSGPSLRVGYVHQKPEQHFFRNTVMDELTWGIRQGTAEYRKPYGYSLSETCTFLGLDLESIAGRSPFALSSSEQRKVALAGFFAKMPDILIFDEPFAYLSREDTKRVIGLIDNAREEGVAFVVVSHNMPDISRVANKVLILDRGKAVYYGPPEDSLKVLQSEESFHKLQTT